MKILRLRSCNINSLKGAHSIDFEAFLQGEALFAITGPTGAGKSTVLDIITCAMYGRTPRLASPPYELMSRHTGECFCEVEFEIKGKVYRSSWSVKRAHKKPDGRFQTAKMELVDVASSKVIESKLREVPKQIQKLSGLDFDRFIQSMMLAQGSFDAFLKAKENDRSALLEKITGTYIYKQISKEVYETYAEQKRSIEDAELALGNIELLDDEQKEQKTKALQALQEEKEQKDAREQTLKAALNWLEQLQKLEKDSHTYATEYERVAKEKEANKEAFETLDLAEKALNVQPVWQKIEALENSLAFDRKQDRKLQEQKEQLTRLMEQKQTEFERLKSSYKQQKSAYENSMAKLKEARVLQTQLEDKTALEAQKRTKAATHLEELAKAFESDVRTLQENPALMQKYYEEHENRVKNTQAQLEKALAEYESIEQKTAGIAAKEDRARQKRHEYETLLDALDAYEKLQEQKLKEQQSIETYTKQIEHQTALSHEKSKLIEQIQTTVESLKQTRDTQLLIKNYEQDRAKLQQGQECFLCGATEHPYLHHAPTVDTDTTTAGIKEQEDYLQEQNRQYNDAKLALAKLETNLENAAGQKSAHQEELNQIQRLFEWAGLAVEKDTKALLTQKIQRCKEQLGEYEALKEQQQRLQRNKENAQTAHYKQQQKQTQIQADLDAFKQVQEEQTGLVQQIQRLQSKSKEILDEHDLDAYEQSTQEKMERVTREYNALQNEIASQSSKKQSITEQIQNLQHKQACDRQSLQQQQQAFAKALKENAFESQKAFEKALLSREHRERLRLECSAIEQRYTQIQALKTDTQKRLQEHKALQRSKRKPEDVNKELEELKRLIGELQESLGSLKKELDIDAHNRKKHKQKIAQLQKKKETFTVWAKLNEMIGSSQGDKFAKFAQGITLDQLIFLANKHLEVLSPRYELKRGSDANKTLEIEIIDGFQGDVVRPVSTLSGGESFIVSLSLALGLSALASQKISIDSLFLDEGFGTLDSDSLELALNALNRLQDSGKMVGVISHVEALKERIPLQIKVVPGGDGTSRVEMSE